MTERRGRGRPPAADPGMMGERLTRACWRLLVEQSSGGAKVSVASICAACECTPPTLYHHFANLDELVRAACEQAFEQWSRSLERRVAGLDSPRERVRRRGLAYVTWGVANPSASRVLFQSPPPAARRAAMPGRGFDALLTDLGSLLGREPDDPLVRTAAFAHWSAVHGLTGLLIVNPEIPEPLWRGVLDHLGDALTAGEPAPPAGRTQRPALGPEGQPGSSDVDRPGQPAAERPRQLGS